MAKKPSKANNNSWYKTGKEGAAKSKQIDKQAQARRELQQLGRRFKLQADSSAKVTFLDTPAFFFSEHNLQLDGKWGNHFTCLSDFGDCPICESGEQASYVVAGTVIDHSTYISKDGTEYRNQKKLMVLKGKARQNILRQTAKKTDLAFKVYEFARGTSTTECGTGEYLPLSGGIH